MPDMTHAIEMVAYSLLSFLPYIALALYPFRHSLRFSLRVTILLVCAATLVQVGAGLWVGLWDGDAGFLSVVSTCMYAFFYLFAVKAHFGKTLFSLLMFSNIANLLVVSSKCIEGVFFPEMAVQGYKWTFSVILLIMEIVVLLPLARYISNTYSTALEKDTSRPTWRFLWLIPATFYIEWYFRLYASGISSLEFALIPRNAIFLFVINLGAFLIYHMVIQHILVVDKNVQLSEQNHALTMQNLQYENLRDRMNEARKFKHDVRHHVIAMRSLLEDKKYNEAAKYLDEYELSMPDFRSVCFCKHYSVNSLLQFYAQQAKNNGIEFDVNVDVPEDISISDNVISVMLGNLLENAVEAARHVDGERKIIIRSVCKGGSILFRISNTYSDVLRQDEDGVFLSTKHSGTGIGITSVRDIVNRNGGMFEITQDKGMFIVTVMLML